MTQPWRGDRQKTTSVTAMIEEGGHFGKLTIFQEVYPDFIWFWAAGFSPSLSRLLFCPCSDITPVVTSVGQLDACQAKPKLCRTRLGQNQIVSDEQSKKMFYMSQYKTRNYSLLLKCVHVYLLFGSVAPPCCTTLSGLRVMMVLTVLSKLSWDWISTEYPASPMFWVVTLQPNSKVEPPTDASRMRLATTFTIGPGDRSGRSII